MLTRDKYGFIRPTAAATRGFTMVSFSEAVSRRNTFVGGACAPPRALLVCPFVCLSVAKMQKHDFLKKN